MIVEKTICDALQTATGVATYFGVQPQGPVGEPSPMPVIIVNRTGSTWPVGLCGTDTALSIATIQVDYYSATAEGCRRYADTGRDTMRDLEDGGAPSCPGLQSEISFYDDMSRAWRISQNWSITDYSPALE